MVRLVTSFGCRGGCAAPLAPQKKRSPSLSLTAASGGRLGGGRPAPDVPAPPLLYDRGYPVGLLIVGVLCGDLVGVRGAPWLVSIPKDLVLSMKRFGIGFVVA